MRTILKIQELVFSVNLTFKKQRLFKYKIRNDRGKLIANNIKENLTEQLTEV